MKEKNKNFMAVLFVLILGCATNSDKKDIFSLQEAIEQSAERITLELPVGSRVAIVAFDSENYNLSDFIMDELAGELKDRNMEVAERRNLEFVYNELNFQMSGNVSDESAMSIGKFLGAELVITGQLRNIGKVYRLTTTAIHVETATQRSVSRMDVQNNRLIKNMINALNRQSEKSNTMSNFSNELSIPKTAGAFFERGILLGSRGDFNLAIMDFTEAIKLNPNYAEAYQLRGRAFYASISDYIWSIGDKFNDADAGRWGWDLSEEQLLSYEMAIEDYDQAIKLDPNNANSYTGRARTYFARIRLSNEDADNFFDLAIADFGQAIRLEPNNVQRYLNRGKAYVSGANFSNHRNLRFNRSISDFSQAIQLEPNNAEWYSLRGYSYSSIGRHDHAIYDYTQAINLDPQNPYRYYKRGEAYGGWKHGPGKGKGDHNLAIADYTQAIKLFGRPNNPDDIFGLALAYYQRSREHGELGNTSQSRLDLESAERIYPYIEVTGF